MYTLGVDIPYPAGELPRNPGPLARFLPPMEVGAVHRALFDFGEAGDLLLDPFGESPRLVLEAASAGRGVLVAANNPVTRFVLQHSLNPFSSAELQSVVAQLAVARKDGKRLENFVLDLYRTSCSNCATAVSADYFVWDKDQRQPRLRGYSCPNCLQAVEEPTRPQDLELAETFAQHQLQHARALELVAPLDDPDRQHAEAALSVYPERALYAVITLLNKLEQLQLTGRQLDAAHALMISVLDAANSLWDYPEGRGRPLRLSPAPAYREGNVWRALERAVGEWVQEPPGTSLIPWSSQRLPQRGEVALFPGRLREVADQLPSLRVLSVLPRPNQAFWTLTALWAALLWGREAAAPIKSALRRRRYEWAWYAGALRSALSAFGARLADGEQALIFLHDAQPPFIAASMAGFDACRFRLEGYALRRDTRSAVLRWTRQPGSWASDKRAQLRGIIRTAVVETLGARAEPCHYPQLHAAAWAGLSAWGGLSELWGPSSAAPLTRVGDELASVLSDHGVFLRLDQRQEIERGIFWLMKPPPGRRLLADRVEEEILQTLRREGPLPMVAVEEAIYQRFPGSLTPDWRFQHACLRSYAGYQDGFWHLNAEDRLEAREEDAAEIASILNQLAQRLGFACDVDELISWSLPTGEVRYRFRIQGTAVLGEAMGQQQENLVLVIPGRRAALVEEKCRRDSRLEEWIKSGPHVVKFRHLRSLLGSEILSPGNLDQQLMLDPPATEDPQMPLL